MQLFYNQQLTVNSKECVLDALESQHLVKVLRKREGDTLWLINGKGMLFEGQITLAHDKKCQVKIVSHQMQLPVRTYRIHVAIAPTKNMDRMEWFAEKATEIGVDEITPLICEHSERKVLKTDRLEKIIVSALKQSGQFYQPKLNEAIKFDEFIKREFEAKTCIAHCVESEKQSLQEALNPDESVVILIGPEGDFSEKEIGKAMERGFAPVTLGKTRLRTETAGIVAVQTLACMNH